MMNHRFFFVLVFCISWICKSSNGVKWYQKFTHAKTGRILTTNGHASYDSFYSFEEQVFHAREYPGGEYVFFDWFLEETSPRALTIAAGCVQNQTVKGLPQNHRSNQDWYIDKDKGTIASGCNKDWLLTVNNYGDQYVQDKSIIPEGEEKWNIQWRVHGLVPDGVVNIRIN